MRAPIRATAALAFAGALTLCASLTGCAASAPDIPVPTAGAAWGAAVVPYSDDLKVTGGWRLIGAASAEADPVATLTVQAGQWVALDIDVTNVGNTNMGVHVLLRDDDRLLDKADAEIARSDKTVQMNSGVLEQMRSEVGFDFGGADSGAVIAITGEFTAPKPTSCDDPRFDVDFEVRAESGERLTFRVSLIVEDPGC
ncbi:hypothetical protein [Rathayibacter sp. VKM Ac-2927]|uniref:hypothetical protein n=1 Tax=Rathayibacter sp. VKM Ac-2927 TaxID=2929478 RepID=UPI001FB31D36|nr:hypothetical protein [Rathayibacter sp. VKM Ac-2927]MCJ1688143.1 hypothetical protein [Rathayibacter sp. VKM Ac-2927]